MKFAFAIMLLMLCFFDLSGQSKERYQAEVRGNMIYIKNLDVFANCSSKFIAKADYEGKSIIITEIDVSTQKTRCNCLFDFEIELYHPSAGDIKLIIQREELKKYGYVKDTLIRLYSTDMKIKRNGSKIQTVLSLDQSECKNSPESAINKKNVEVAVNNSKSTASLNFFLSEDSDVAIQLYNLLGKQIATFKRTSLSSGANSISISTKDLPAGMYIGKLIDNRGNVSSFRLTLSR